VRLYNRVAAALIEFEVSCVLSVLHFGICEAGE